MRDHRVFLSHTSDLDVASPGELGFVETAIRTIATMEGLTLEEQSTTFTAEDQPSAEVCRRRLAGCDIYVGVVGCERGTQVEGDRAGRSFVELEFDLAGEQGIPRIILLWEPRESTIAGVSAAQSEFRTRLSRTQEIVFQRFRDHGDLRVGLQGALERYQPGTSEHVSCHVEWATPEELKAVPIFADKRLWAVHVRNGGDYPALNVIVTVHSNNGGIDETLDFGTVPARDVRNSPYILNLERDSFDGEGDRPIVEMDFMIAGVAWHRLSDGSLVRKSSGPSARRRKRRVQSQR